MNEIKTQARGAREIIFVAANTFDDNISRSLPFIPSYEVTLLLNINATPGMRSFICAYLK